MSRYIDADALLINESEACINAQIKLAKKNASKTIDAERYINQLAHKRIQMLIADAPTIEVVPKDFHDKTCEAMAKRHTEEIQRLMPKQGEWKLFYESKDGDNVYKCSCCRFITVIPEGIKLFSFCPNCGADMRKESE